MPTDINSAIPVTEEDFNNGLFNGMISGGLNTINNPTPGPLANGLTALNNALAKTKKAGLTNYANFLQPITDQLGKLDTYSKTISNLYGGLGGVLSQAGQQQANVYGDISNRFNTEYEGLKDTIANMYSPEGRLAQEANTFLGGLANNVMRQAAVDAAQTQGLRTKYGLSQNAINALNNKNKIDSNNQFLSLMDKLNQTNQGIFDKYIQYTNSLLGNQANLATTYDKSLADQLYNSIVNLGQGYANTLLQGPTIRNLLAGGGTGGTGSRGAVTQRQAVPAAQSPSYQASLKALIDSINKTPGGLAVENRQLKATGNPLQTGTASDRTTLRTLVNAGAVKPGR